jgi:hypothetical protein
MLEAMLIGMGMVLVYALVALVLAMRSRRDTSHDGEHHHA